jgi:hypothetical protein
MSRRRLVTAIVCSVFLLLIVSTVHSLFSDIENAEAETTSMVGSHESATRTYYTSGSSHARSRRRDESPDRVIATADSADAGVDEVFARELTLCIVTDCMRRRSSGDASVVAALPPPPPKVR